MSFPSPGDHPASGIKPRSPALQADALTSESPGKEGPFTFYVFMYFWLCWVFVAVRGLSLVVVVGLLISVAPLVAEHRL